MAGGGGAAGWRVSRGEIRERETHARAHMTANGKRNQRIWAIWDWNQTRADAGAPDDLNPRIIS